MNFNLIILPVVRHFLQVLAGALMAAGYLDEENAATLTGALLGLITVAWWFFTKPSKGAAEAAKAVDKGEVRMVEGTKGPVLVKPVATHPPRDR